MIVMMTLATISIVPLGTAYSYEAGAHGDLLLSDAKYSLVHKAGICVPPASSSHLLLSLSPSPSL